MRLLLLEVAFVLVALIGVGMLNMSAALIIGGVLGTLACERGSAGMRAGGGGS